MYGEIDGFLETFKYALKFSDLELSDNLHAYKTLKGKRLINSFGALRGVEVPEELTDDDLDDDLPYMLMLYTYRKGSGYNFPSNGQRTYHEILHQKRQRLLACTGQRLYPKPKRSLCFHSRPNVAVCFQSGRLHAPQTILNILKGTHYTLLCKVAHNYKTITPKYSPKTPKAVWGFSFRCETATKCQGRRSRAFHP